MNKYYKEIKETELKILYGKKSKTLNIRISEEAMKWLKKEAELQNVSMSQLVSMFIASQCFRF
jgi:predicted HicB family RNase H-like nuclease